KVVAKLRHHITTPIVEKLLAHRERLTSFTLLVQSELADRIKARQNTREFSCFSLFVQFHCAIQSSFKVAASCFCPKPKVDSKVIHLTLKPPLLENSAPFFAMTRRAFQQRRKMIRVSL